MSAAPEIRWGERIGKTADGFRIEIARLVDMPRGWIVRIDTPVGTRCGLRARSLAAGKVKAAALVASLRRF